MVGHSIAYVSVGSNLGDKIQNCLSGIASLEANEGIWITGRSRFYRTEPVDLTGQSWFVNGAVRMESKLGAFELLERMQVVEREAGRPPDHVRFGPRILDLDLVMYDQLIVEHPRLHLPHPRMHCRRFVLQPLCDIDPHIVHPLLGKAVHRLLSELDERGQQVVPL